MTYPESRTHEEHGHVTWIGETELKGVKQFPVRKFRMETDGGKYSQMLEFEVTSERCGELDGLRVGEPVSVRFNLRGREWSRNAADFPKVFLSLNAWKIESTEHAEDRDERLQRQAHEGRGRIRPGGQAYSDEPGDTSGAHLDERGEAFSDSDIPF